MGTAIMLSVVYVWISEHKTLFFAGLAIFLILIISLILRRRRKRAAYLALPVIYIGNRSTKTYHTPGCRMLSNISPANLVAFRIKGEPERMGYSRCGNCKP